MTKSELREMIRECIQEELNAGAIAETLNVKNSDGHFSIVQFAKNIHDNLVANKVDCVVSLVDGYKIKVECDDFKGVDDLVRNTKELVINNQEPDIEDHGSYRLYMLKQKATQASRVRASQFNIKDSDGPHSVRTLAKNIYDNLVANKATCVVSLVDGYKIKIECNNFKGIDDLVKNTKELVANNLEPVIEDHGSYRLYMLRPKANNKINESASTKMNWDDLIQEADNLLLELIRKSGNANYDDGDGYWQEEYTIWCNRKLYYIRLNDAAELEKLCAEYSKKLPNVEFYFYDDEDEEVSEIGYVATK